MKSIKRVATITVWDANAKTEIRIATAAGRLTRRETEKLLRAIVRRLAGSVCSGDIPFANYGVDRMRVKMVNNALR